MGGGYGVHGMDVLGASTKRLEEPRAAGVRAGDIGGRECGHIPLRYDLYVRFLDDSPYLHENIHSKGGGR